MRGAEAELSAPGFESLSDDEIAQAIRQLASLAFSPEVDAAAVEDQEFVRALDRNVGRWTRRKLRKILDNVGSQDLADLNWKDWREDLRVTAACVALDRCEGDLRSALITLSMDLESDDPEPVSDSTNITHRVKGSPLARNLLARVMQSWCNEVAEHG